ncbi:MAG: glucosaminidase domain-containing protein [Hyphomicrobiaceae bacterium]
MTRILASSLAAAFLLLPATQAMADVPAIKTSPGNQVDACVTPGRLMAFVKSRNERLDPRFDRIAVEYMRQGERLGLRWDYTFYQMMLETGNLSFRGDRGRRGDVSPRQNNFAGLGATGNGASGESFPDVATGVLAHLQHVLIYAGETVENPVAERTRKVQEWGILKSMQRRARGSVTFRHLAHKWAPGSDYVSGLQAIASRFEEGFCNRPDPHPEWVAEARGQKPAAAVAQAAPVKEQAQDRISGAELARRAIEEGKDAGDNRRSGLGVGAATMGRPSMPSPSYSILNAPASDPAPRAGAAAADTTANVTAKPPTKSAPLTMASAAGTIGTTSPRSPQADRSAAAPKAGGKCRVWTASYGGQKALIIRVNSEKGTDFTVLDVNEGAEKREAEAYIAAYAKGGTVEAEFASQTQALDKAFELCPEG